MEVLVKISEEEYNTLKNAKDMDCEVSHEADLILEGKVLPKRHGDLIDIDAAFDEYDRTPKTMISVVTDAPVVIEANKERE